MSECSNQRRRAMRRSALAIVLMAAVLGGCSLAPQFVRPTLPVADAFPLDATADATGDARRAVDTGWRDFFPDPRLQALVQMGLANNRDLRSAVLRIEETRALYNIQSADLLPTINGTAGGARGRGLAAGNGGQTIVASSYQVGLSLASFELDFFGRVRSLNDAALAQYLASAEARQSVQISLIASAIGVSRP